MPRVSANNLKNNNDSDERDSPLGKVLALDMAYLGLIPDTSYAWFPEPPRVVLEPKA